MTKETKKRLPISEITSVENSQDTVWTHRVMRLPKVEEKTSTSFAHKTIQGYRKRWTGFETAIT